MRVPLSRHGIREITLATLLLAAAAVALSRIAWPLALIPLALLLFVYSFFRDPERSGPDDPELLLSPADGTVSDIEEVEKAPLLDEPCLRIGIFLSVFNVHVNRAPLSGRVFRLAYRPGQFLDARHPEAGARNESNDILLRGATPVVVRQIAGLIARRIICTLREGESVTRGQRIGMIKFGSRTELYLPLRVAPEALVKVGDRVRGASSKLARFRQPESES